MPQKKKKGRPGGYPEIWKHGFSTEREEPLKAQIHVRVSESMKERLLSLEDWNEFVRVAIAKELEALEEEAKVS